MVVDQLLQEILTRIFARGNVDFSLLRFKLNHAHIRFILPVRILGNNSYAYMFSMNVNTLCLRRKIEDTFLNN